MSKTMTTSEQQIASARGMHEAMRHQRDKAWAGLDAAQAEIRRQRARADRAETALDQAPHDSMCALDYMVSCNCWKSEATA